MRHKICFDQKGIALLEVMVSVALLAIGVVAALQTIAYSSKVSSYAAELQRGSLVSMKWLDSAYDSGHEAVLQQLSAVPREGAIDGAVKATFDKNSDLSTPGYDAYDLKLEVPLRRMGKEEALAVQSLVVEKNAENNEAL